MSDVIDTTDVFYKLNQVHKLLISPNVNEAQTALTKYRYLLASSGTHPDDVRIEDARGPSYSRDRRLIDGLQAKVEELQKYTVAYQRVCTPAQQKEVDRLAKISDRWREFATIVTERWPHGIPTDAELARLVNITKKQLIQCREGTFQITDTMLRRLKFNPIPPVKPAGKKKPKQPKLTLVVDTTEEEAA